MNRFFKFTFGLWAVLLTLAVRGATPEVGKDVLRGLVKLPAVSFQANWTFDPERGFLIGSTEQDLAAQITSLQGKLKQDSSDAETWRQLAELYTTSHDAASAANAWRQAADGFRQRLKSQPDDATLLAGLGRALQGTGKMSEAESVLRKAVGLAPKEWRCQVALGHLLDAAARQDIFENIQVAANSNEVRPSSGGVTLAQRRLTEAGESFDRAVAAAPEESEVYFSRGMHSYSRAVLLNEIRIGAGESKADVERSNNPFSTEALADLQHASRLSPKDYSLIGGTALFEIYTASTRNGRMDWADFSWSSLPDKSQHSLRDAVTRLENLAQNPDAQQSAGALEVLGILQGPILHETNSAVTNLRRALALDPSREQAWEVLVALVAQAGRYEELLTACQDRLKQKDSPRAHLLLAKAYEKLKRWDDVEPEILETLRQSPKDLTANLALGALLLRRSQNADLLADANSWLTRTERLLNDVPVARRNPQLVIDLTLTRSIYFALTDQVEIARKWAQAVLKRDKNNKRARDIISAMDY